MLDREDAIAALCSVGDIDRFSAEQCLAQLHAAGFLVAPIEATDPMVSAQPGSVTTHQPSFRRALWRAMSNAGDVAAPAREAA